MVVVRRWPWWVMREDTSDGESEKNMGVECDSGGNLFAMTQTRNMRCISADMSKFERIQKSGKNTSRCNRVKFFPS